MPQFQQPRNIKKTFTDFVNKVFSLNNTWVNEDVEVVTLTDDNSPKAYEQYPWDNENYPIVVLFSNGSQADDWAIDSLVSSNIRSTYHLGVTPTAYQTLSINPISAGITPLRYNMTIQNIEVLVKNIGPYEEPIYIDVYNDIAGEPGTVLASGSIQGVKTKGIEWLQTPIKPHVSLTKDTSYHITARAPSGSYYWFTDDDIASAVNPDPSIGTYDGASWTMTSNTSPVTKIHSPSMMRLGGGIRSNIRFFCEAKDLATAQKITDLLYVYLHLAKHSNSGRRVKLTYPGTMTAMDFDFVSDLTTEGIYIIDVSKGAETVRNRGSDRLFGVDITVSCYSTWAEDFDIPTFEDVNDMNIESVQQVFNKY